jgi:hypothetical protein
VLVQEEAPQVGHESAGPGYAVALGDVRHEIVQPPGRFVELFAEMVTSDERATGVLLPAGRAQAEPGMAP